MRTARKEETSLAGNVQTFTLACPATGAAQALSAVESELRASNFEILFSDREQPENGWVTGRSGKKWVELVSVPDGESMSYALTVVPSAEVLTAAKSEPAQVADAKPEPIIAQQAATPPESEKPVVAAATPPPVTMGFVPPSIILEAPIQPTDQGAHKVTGDILIEMLVDINERGTVTKAELTGHITRDVLKLESDALDAVWRWRFEPARLDGRVVAAEKVPVQLHFHGKPGRF
jgi:hypothetical protein